MSKTVKPLDLVIIGAGPIGLACAIEAKKAGLNYVILEKGCLVNSIFYYPVNMTFFSTSERLEIGGVPFVSHGVKPTRREALEYYRRVVDAYKLRVHTYERVENIEQENDNFTIETIKRDYKCKNVIISTGYYDNVNLMGIPGEDLKHKVFHYFKEAHPFAGKDVAVIGAGNSAVDVALELYRTGARVTMIIREPEIKKSIKYWVRPDIENRLKEEEIKSYFNASLVKITERELFFEQNKKLHRIKNHFVFAMTGYHPDLSFLNKHGVRIEKNKCPYYNRKTLETNIKGLYLAGVVCGGMETDKLFIENSIEHSELIIKDILKKNKFKKSE